MKIFLITETLHAGGAETFVVRLANAIVGRHEVVVVNLYPELSREQIMAQLDSRISQINIKFKGKSLLRKIDSLLSLANIDFSFVERLFLRKLKQLVNDLHPEIIHSHLFKPDYYVSLLRRYGYTGYRHVSTSHGDYLLYEKQTPWRLLNYQQKLLHTLSSLDHAVVISEEQVQWMETAKKNSSSTFRIHKILNGYSSTPTVNHQENGLLNLDRSDFVFGMVSRGIKEKGWHSSIRAFRTLPYTNIKLILVGAGDEIDMLRELYHFDDRIIFAGYSPSPISYIQMFDVCLLPTYCGGESLPTVIIEYLLSEKPIIATDVGEIKNMLLTPTGESAGYLLRPVVGGVDEVALLKAMQEVYNSPQVIERLKANAKEAFAKFDMKACTTSYLRVYSE